MRGMFKRKTGFENAEYRRVIGEETRLVSPAPGRAARPVTLVPMRSLSLAPFSFPFSGASKVREALKLQVLPYSAAGDFELFPVALGKRGRGSSGVVWYVSPAELVLPDDADANSLVWPAPLPLAAGVDGTGVTLWADEDNLCSILWQDYTPAVYRWRPRSKSSPDAEFDWFDKYCADGGESGLARGESFIFDAAETQVSDVLASIVRDSAEKCPWLASVNLSRTAIQGAMNLERSVSLMTRAACWMLLMGAIVLGGSAIKLYRERAAADDARARSESLYREVFEPGRTGRISNPVTLARDIMAGFQSGGGTSRGLDGVMKELGAVFSENPSMDIKLDVLRYNADGIDCTGSAPDMSTVLTFRRAWESRASLSQLDNTQSVSGIGYRFDLRVRW